MTLSVVADQLVRPGEQERRRERALARARGGYVLAAAGQFEQPGKLVASVRVTDACPLSHFPKYLPLLTLN
jgi:hypothetical protein